MAPKKKYAQKMRNVPARGKPTTFVTIQHRGSLLLEPLSTE